MNINCFQKYGLRSYQEDSCIELMAKFSGKDNIPLLLVMPTGTGKTRTAVSLCLELLSSSIINRIVWVAHRYELLDQAKDTLELCCYLKYGKKLNDYINDKISNSIKIYEDESYFEFSMNTTFSNKLGQIDNNTLVVYDEAHHCVSENNTYCLDKVKEKNARILGLTATPFRMNGDIPFVWNFTKKLEETEYKELVERAEYSIVEKITISAAIINGYLCKFKIFGIDVLGDIYNEWLQNKDKVTWQDYYYNAILKTIVSIIRDNSIKDHLPRPKDGKILIFSKNANKLYQDLKDNKLLIQDEIGIGLLTSGNYGYKLYDRSGNKIEHNDSSIELRNKIIEYFSNENVSDKDCIGVLINNSILTEGFDEPKVTDIILTYDTDSIIRMTQIIGRGLRPYGDENRGCYIYNLASAKIVEKIYNGKYTIKDMSDIVFGGQVGVNDEGNIVYVASNISKNNQNIKTAFPRSMIYSYIKALNLCNEFEISGVLIVDELIQCFVAKQDIEVIEKCKIPSRLPNIFAEMLKDMYKKWQKYENKELFKNSFIEYLRSCGKYKYLEDKTKYDVNVINSTIKSQLNRICEKIKATNSYISDVVEDIIKEDITNYTQLDIDFYSGEVLKMIMKIGG